MEPLGSFAKE